MKLYEVVRHDGAGRHRGTFILPGLEPGDVMPMLDRMAPSVEPMTHDVYRIRRFRRPRHLVTFGPRGDDGSAGVREPRRPLPHPPGLRAEAELHRDSGAAW